MKFHQLKLLQKFKVPNDETIYVKVAQGNFNAMRVRPVAYPPLVRFEDDQHIEWRSN